MTSFEVNLLDNESKSSRSKAVSHRVRKYLSDPDINVKIWNLMGKDLTMTRYMSTDLCQGMAYIHVRAQQIVVFGSVPFLERGQFLRNRRKKADDDAYRGRLHVLAEFADNFLVL